LLENSKGKETTQSCVSTDAGRWINTATHTARQVEGGGREKRRRCVISEEERTRIEYSTFLALNGRGEG